MLFALGLKQIVEAPQVLWAFLPHHAFNSALHHGVVTLFALGAVFAYVTLPKALDFLLGFAGEGVVPLITFDRYMGFVVLVTLAFGISFLFPVLLVFLEAVGVLSTRKLREWRRWAILGIAIFAAVITPSGDPYTMFAMMIPMYLFYEGSIIIGRMMKR